MAESRIVSKTSFSAGELSPRYHSRTDTDEFKHGVETASNLVTTLSGSMKKRNGTKFIAEVKDSSAACILATYQTDLTNAFQLELGNLYMRFYKNGAQVLESDVTISGLTQADPGVVTATAHNFANGDHVYITGVAGMTEVNSTTVPYLVANVTAHTFEIQDLDGVDTDTSAFTAYSSGGVANRIYTITTPYQTADLSELQSKQSGTTLYIAHPSYAPRTLVRTTDTNWTLATQAFDPQPTYEAGHDFSKTLNIMATTGTDIKAIVGSVNLTDGATYRWTASGFGTAEYYLELFAGGDPSVSTPLVVAANSIVLTEGTAGSLAAGTYDYGDNDTLGYSTIYVRLSDGTDPDTKASEYVVYSESDTLLTGDEGRPILNLTTDEAGEAIITSVTNGALAVVDIVTDFTDTNTIASGDWILDFSPQVALEVTVGQVGAISNMRSEYFTGSLGPRKLISAITQANPAVVTTTTAHGYVTGDKVQIQDIIGMSTLNGKVFTVTNVTSTTFSLNAENSTGYPAWISGGIVRKKLDELSKPAFRAQDVGSYIILNGGVGQIVSVNTSTDIDVEILKSLNDIDLSSDWTLEVPTWDATRGFPKTLGMFQQRLWYASTTAQPQTLWGSEIGALDNFGVGPDDEDSIEIDISSDHALEVSWMAGGRDLIVGTTAGEHAVTSATGSAGAITPGSNASRARTAAGSSSQETSKVGEEIIFIDRTSKKLLSMRYDFNLDGYATDTLTLLGEHLTDAGLDKAVWAKTPDQQLYVVTTDGKLLVGTYDRSLKIISWTKQITDGYYEDVEVLRLLSSDQVWVIVKRKVNGKTKRFVELFEAGTGEDDLDAFSDSFLTLSTPKTITGITNASPAVVTSTSHGFSNGDEIIIKSLVDPLEADLVSTKTNMSSLNKVTFTVANKTAHTFELTGKDTSAYNAYGSGGEAFLKVTALSGLDHLEGKTVSVRGDGATQPTKVVSGGAITATTAAGEFVVGLPYTATLKTLSFEFDTGIGSSQGQRVRWVKPLVNVYRSSKPTVNGEYLPARSAADLMDQKVPLFTGFLSYASLNWDTTSALTLTDSNPLPLEILGISGKLEFGIN